MCTVECKQLLALVVDDLTLRSCDNHDPAVEHLFDHANPSCGYPFFGPQESGEHPIEDGWQEFKGIMADHYAFFEKRGILDFLGETEEIPEIPEPAAFGGRTNGMGMFWKDAALQGNEDVCNKRETLFKAINSVLRMFKGTGKAGLGDGHLSVDLRKEASGTL